MRGIVRSDRQDTERGELEEANHSPRRNDGVENSQAVDVLAPQDGHSATDGASVRASAYGRKRVAVPALLEEGDTPRAKRLGG